MRKGRSTALNTDISIFDNDADLMRQCDFYILKHEKEVVFVKTTSFPISYKPSGLFFDKSIFEECL